MTIRLDKKEELSGQIWYNVYINDSCDKSFLNEPEARDYYTLLLSRLDQGYPKTETILTHTI